MLYSAKEMEGYTLGASDGDIGGIESFYFDDQQWTVRYVVADTGSWLSGRSVLIPPIAFGLLDRASKRIEVNLTREQIEKSPDADTKKPISRQYEAGYFNYYGWPYYWQGPGLWGYAGLPKAVTSPQRAPGSEQEAAVQTLHREGENGDPHLRSTQEVKTYAIHASNGELGHAEDFLIEEETWTIRYLVVDTTSWWPSGRVVISPRWVKDIRMRENAVEVAMTKEALKGAPPYEAHLLDRPYEVRLHDYHNQQGYWEER